MSQYFVGGLALPATETKKRPSDFSRHDTLRVHYEKDLSPS
ncbi:hypothetical protein [Tolypothrix sp. NIES-4075]|nr:hypothetical protein [Tolypothrix sp. NIES-4075]